MWNLTTTKLKYSAVGFITISRMFASGSQSSAESGLAVIPNSWKRVLYVLRDAIFSKVIFCRYRQNVDIDILESFKRLQFVYSTTNGGYHIIAGALFNSPLYNAMMY